MIQKCPLCEKTGTILQKETHIDKGTTYTLFECTLCSAQFWNPLKNPGAEWYEHDTKYAQRNVDPILKPNLKHKDTIGYLSNSVGKVLDVGCGVGNFLALAQKKGWDCWGIDFDRDSIVTAKNTFGLDNLEPLDLTTFIQNHSQERFNLVTFFDVFEHIDNHVAFITEVKSVLQPAGYIALSVPYKHSWRFLVPHDWPPRHLTRWDDVSISYFLEANGFTVKKIWKESATWYFLVMKLRWKYGKFVRFGLVKSAKQKAYVKNATQTTSATAPTYSASIKLMHAVAKAKDVVLFGIPALVVWMVLQFTDKRNTDFYLIAQVKND